MKKTILKSFSVLFLVGIVLFSFSNCQQDENVANSVEEEKLIDFDVTKSASDMSKAELLLAEEAFKIMDSHIQLQKDQFVLNVSDGKSLGLSDRVFNFYKSRMISTNEIIKGAILIPTNSGKYEIRLPGYNSVEARVAGGETKIVSDWFTFDLYLSNKTLQALAAGAGLAGTLAGLAPEPTVSKIVATIAGFCSFGFGMLAIYYPDGVIISCVYVPIPYPGGCIPYDLESQKP